MALVAVAWATAGATGGRTTAWAGGAVVQPAGRSVRRRLIGPASTVSAAAEPAGAGAGGGDGGCRGRLFLVSRRSATGDHQDDEQDHQQRRHSARPGFDPGRPGRRPRPGSAQRAVRRDAGESAGSPRDGAGVRRLSGRLGSAGGGGWMASGTGSPGVPPAGPRRRRSVGGAGASVVAAAVVPAARRPRRRAAACGSGRSGASWRLGLPQGPAQVPRRRGRSYRGCRRGGGLGGVQLLAGQGEAGLLGRLGAPCDGGAVRRPAAARRSCSCAGQANRPASGAGAGAVEVRRRRELAAAAAAASAACSCLRVRAKRGFLAGLGASTVGGGAGAGGGFGGR